MCAAVEDFVFIRYRKLVDRVRFGLRLDCAAHTRRRQVCTRRLSAWNGRNAEQGVQHDMSSSLGGNFAWCVPKSFRICSQPATSRSDFHRLPLHDIARGLPERRTNCPHRKDAYRPPSPPRSVSSGRTISKKRRHSSRMSASTEPMCGNLLEMRTRASPTVPASTAVSGMSLVVFALVVARSALGGPTTWT